MVKSRRSNYFALVCGVLGLTFWANGAFGVGLTEDFSSRSRFGSGNLVWNSSLGYLHVPLQVYQFNNGAYSNRIFSVGDGRHGSFDASRFSEFSEGRDLSGQVIRLNTDTYPELQFTHFHLPSGWTLKPVGSKPLSIQVMGWMLIEGVIDCSGDAGQNFNGDLNNPARGGEGRCGGGDGGDGGSLLSVAGSGATGGPVITNGHGPGIDGPTVGGAATGTSSGGGGGGSYGTGPDQALSGAGTLPGAGGYYGKDPGFTVIGSGFGGGGGDYNSTSAAIEWTSGGGGGAGGGTISITAGGAITISGQVLAQGGDGGGALSTFKAGGGGGGGGGSILMFSGGDVYLLSGMVVSADGGQGGAGGGAPGQDGGRGASGRTWLVGSSGDSIMVPPNAVYESPPSYLLDLGDVRQQTGVFTVTSGAIDLGNSRPTLTSIADVSTVPGGAQVNVFYASHETPDEPASYNPVSSLPQKLERYFWFKVEVTNTLVAEKPIVTSLQVEGSGFRQEDFELQGACGHIQSATPPTDGGFIYLLPLLLLLWLSITRTIPSPN